MSGTWLPPSWSLFPPGTEIGKAAPPVGERVASEAVLDQEPPRRDESEEEGEDGEEDQEAQVLPSRGSIWISAPGPEVLGLPGQPPRAHSPRQSLPTEPGQLQGSPGEVDGSKDYFFLQQQPGCNSPATTPTQAPSSRGTAPGLKAGRVLRSANGLLSFPISWLFSPRVLSLSMIQGSGGIVISPW